MGMALALKIPNNKLKKRFELLVMGKSASAVTSIEQK